MNGTMLSRVNSETFFVLVEKFSQPNESNISFPLEYYLGESFIFLYKTIAQKTYKTIIPILLSLTSEEDQVARGTVFHQGKQIPIEEFLRDIQTNHKAIELLEPIDYEDIILKHNHDLHDHAGVGFDDILR